MAEKQFIQVQVPESTHQIEILEGQALNPQPPRRVEIIGKINAPAAWWKVRKDKVNINKCHVLVTSDDITLHIEEDDFYRHSYISGKLRVDDECARWGINNEQTMYEPKMLARLIKANEFLFAKREEWAAMVGALMRFESNVQVNLKDIKETNGDIDRALKVTVNNSVPQAFQLNTRIYDAKRYTYMVEVGAEFVGHQVKFYLDSADLAFMMAKQGEELINSNIKVFTEDEIPIIYT